MLLNKKSTGRDLYNEAMSATKGYLKSRSSEKLLDLAITTLMKMDESEGIVVIDGETIVNVREALNHLNRRKKNITAWGEKRSEHI